MSGKQFKKLRKQVFESSNDYYDRMLVDIPHKKMVQQEDGSNILTNFFTKMCQGKRQVYQQMKKHRLVNINFSEDNTQG